jgi:hypothetical protein
MREGDFDWTPAAVAHLSALRASGLSVARAAEDLGVSKATISGKIHRMKVEAAISLAAAARSPAVPLTDARRVIFWRDWQRGVHALTILGRLNEERGHTLTIADVFSVGAGLFRPAACAAEDRDLRPAPLKDTAIPAPAFSLAEQFRLWCKSRGVDAHQFAVDFVSATQQVSA